MDVDTAGVGDAAIKPIKSLPSGCSRVFQGDSLSAGCVGGLRGKIPAY